MKYIFMIVALVLGQGCKKKKRIGPPPTWSGIANPEQAVCHWSGTAWSSAGTCVAQGKLYQCVWNREPNNHYSCAEVTTVPVMPEAK